jgi:hypothetical protein
LEIESFRGLNDIPAAASKPLFDSPPKQAGRRRKRHGLDFAGKRGGLHNHVQDRLSGEG